MKRQYIIYIILGVISLILVLWLLNTEILRILELRFLDYRFYLRPQHRVNSSIVIAGIDDGSIEIIGRWPWGRNIHAEFLKRVSQYPPKVVGYDILFTESEKETQGDLAMRYYSRLLGNVVYAGYIKDIDKAPVYPIKELMDVSQVGFINVPPDKDGIIRRIPLIVGGGYPSFTLQVLLTYLDIDFKDIRINLGKDIVVPKIGRIPIDKDGFMWINFVGDQHVFREIAFHKVLSRVNTKWLGNTLLLVGLTATGVTDQGHIPIATNVPLVVVHANALNTILNRDFIIKSPLWTNLIIILVCIFLSSFINIIFRPVRAGLFSLFLILFYITTNLWLFRENIWVDILGPCIGFVIPFLLITVYRYGWEEHQRRWIRKAFTHYLSGDVIDVILKDPKRLRLGGELKTATVLYMDIHNFSTYCEGRPPHEIVDFLNEVFNWMTEIILKHGGLLDKYIGDAIMSIFGAPIEMDLKKQAEEAVLAALEIVEEWHKLPENVRNQLDIGIGINTGPMLIGNMGSRYIFNYTAIGDEVNISARVQALTDDFKANIIITESVYNLVRDRFKIESLGEVMVKGRKGNVKIYKVVV